MQIHYLYKEIQSFQVSQVYHLDPDWCVYVCVCNPKQGVELL